MTHVRPSRPALALTPVAGLAALAAGILVLAPPDARAQCAAPDFKLPPVTIDVGSGPQGIAVLDVKRDGAMDLVTADALSDSITFAFGDGTGSLTGILTQPLGAGSGPVAVAVADFDLDGIDDVAVANGTAGTLRAVLLDGAGAVKLPLPNAAPVAPFPSALVAGDFDRDGKPDLVSASADVSGTVEFLKGNGDGTFTSTSQALLGGAPQDITAGDFNRDGRLDVAVVAQHLAAVPPDPRIHLVFGDGNGGWLGVNSFPVALSGSRPIALAVGDVDNDGDLDVVTGDTASTDIVALLGNGLGNLVAQPKFFGVFGTTSLVLADFDGNGILDLGVARELSGGVSVFTGNGLGGFLNRRDFSFAPLTDDARDLAVGDFDNDGRPDLVGSSRLTNKAVLLVNAYDPACPNPSFAGAGRLRAPLGVSSPTDAASGDWDGDGIVDLAIAGLDQLAIVLGDGTLGFGPPATHLLPGGLTGRHLAVADFDLDSDLDIAVANDGTSDVSVFTNAGGIFGGPASVPTGSTPRGIVAGDFNGDGRPDLVTLDNGGPSLTFLPGNGDGTFGAPTTTPLGVNFLTAIAAADVDGDLKLDVAVTNEWTHVVEWLAGDGLGGFTSLGSQPAGTVPLDVILEDVNGDGLPDTVVSSRLPGNVAVLLNLGGGSFAPPTFTPVGVTPATVRPFDANGDGKIDLVTSNFTDLTVLLGDGTGSYPTTRTVLGLRSPRHALPLDADRNGKVDLVVPSSTGASGIHVLPGDGAGGFGPLWTSPGTRSQVLASADFDRDGLADLVTFADLATDMTFLKGKGDGTFEPPTLWPTGLSYPWTPGVGDFDRNGTLDVLVPDRNSAVVAFLAGDGSGGFAAPVTLGTGANTPSNYHLAVGDFDRDGRLDFVKPNGTADSLSLHYGDGLGGFTAPMILAAGARPRDIVVLDFDRDGILDLAVSNFNDNTVSLFQGRGNRLTPFALVETLDTDLGPDGLATGDFDGDGVVDLLVSQQSADPSTIAYFRGKAGAIAPPFFEPRDDYDLGDSSLAPSGIGVADVNLDGRLDAVVACIAAGADPRQSVRVLTGTGDPTPGLGFGPADAWSVAQVSPRVITIADFDRDGRPDFATGDNTSNPNRVSVVLNTNCIPRRLRPTRNVWPCNSPSVPFAMQPAIQIEDDGANPIQCDMDPVTAKIFPGSGTPGANLLGITPLAPTSGVADWSTVAGASQLSVDTEGKKYQLEFTHPKAGLTYSRTFSVSPLVAISGPSSFCAASTGFFSADPGFDTYLWYVDGAGPVSWASSVTVGPLPVGPHTVRVDTTADMCLATQSQPFDVFNNLTGVSVAPVGLFSVCTSCTDATLTATDMGGGAVTRKWAYRTTAGSGPLTYIAGETGASYTIDGSDFPGQGTYYVVEETTPQCGVPTISNEVEVQVTATTTADVVPVFTVRSTSQLNRLEWVYPSGSGTVAIRYNTSGTWGGCTPPATVASGFSDIPDQTDPGGGYGVFDHGVFPLPPLTNNQTYCYSIFAELSPGVYSVNTRSVSGRPFDTSGAVKWAFSVGMSTLEPPGLGAGVLHIVSNDEFLYAMEKGATGGSWPPGWTPFKSTGPSQARPVSVPIGVGPASHVIYLGSQAAAGNNALAVDADTGLGLWGQPLLAPVQAGPAGIFTSFGGSIDAILLGTYDTGGPNAFHARDPVAGNSLGAPWPYAGEPPGNEIGIISAQAAVDYLYDRVFFTSYRQVPGTSDSVWCVELSTASRCAGWPVGVTAGLGDIWASPTLRGLRLYVSPLVGGNAEVQALDADNGSPLWTPPFQPGDGQLKLFIVPNVFGSELYFSTDTMVWAITDAGGSANLDWQRPIPGPSQPVFYAGTGRVYVGGSDGQLYILNASNGFDVVPPITLGEPGFAVAGAPTVDQAGGFVYLGTVAGVVFAVAIP